MSEKFEIKIIEGHNYSSYFWFKPVIIAREDKVEYDDVTELEEEFSIEEGDVECFLYYFFAKFFDKELPFNKNRYELGEYIENTFEWYLTYNFYTYETAEAMIKEILETAHLLETDYNNSSLEELKKDFSIYYMCPYDCPDYKSGNEAAIQKHISVVISFYRRFAERLSLMIKNNPSANIISIMGP